MGRSVAPRRRNERSGDEENELKIGGENDLGVKANNRMLVAEVPTQGPAPLAIRSIAHGALVRVPHWLCSLAPAVPHQRGKKISPFNLVEKKTSGKKTTPVWYAETKNKMEQLWWCDFQLTPVVEGSLDEANGMNACERPANELKTL